VTEVYPVDRAVLVIRTLKRPKSVPKEVKIIALALVWSIVSQTGVLIEDQETLEIGGELNPT
jgi:hypothetical protein